MTSAGQHRVRLLPIGWLRAATLTFIGCLALIQFGIGAAVGEAWRSRRVSGTWYPEDSIRMDSLVRELRSVEIVVAICALVSIMLWSFFAVVNVRLAARSHRSPLAAMMSWTLAPALLALATTTAAPPALTRGSTLMAGCVVLLLYVPFRLLTGAAEVVGASRFSFTGWYLATAAALLVHEGYTQLPDLLLPGHDGDLRRVAMMLVANGFVIGVSALLGIDATRSFASAAAERAFRHNASGDEAVARFTYVNPDAYHHPAPVPMPGARS